MGEQEGSNESQKTSATNWKRLRSNEDELEGQNGEQLPSSSADILCSSTSILDLPDECIAMVLNEFNEYPLELGRIMTVCKRFYEICCNIPSLWRTADFLFKYRDYKPPAQRKKFLDPESVKRRELFAKFLAKRKAKLYAIRLYSDLPKEIEIARHLIWNCCSKELKHVIFMWISWEPYRYDESEEERRANSFREVFERLTASCPDIFSLQIQLDGSCATARLLGSRLTNINHLNVSFVTLKLEHERSSSESCEGPIEIILFYLRNLLTLRLSVELKSQHLLVYDNPFHGYVLKSDSLEYLDISGSVNLLIREMRLPKLYVLVAEKSESIMQGRPFCLYELIEEGCPSLTKINHITSETPGLQNFFISDEEKISMRLCMCQDHNFLVHQMAQNAQHAQNEHQN